MSDREISIEAAARLSGYSGRHLRRLAKRGTIKARQVGKRFWLLDRNSLLAHKKEMDELGADRHAHN